MAKSRERLTADERKAHIESGGHGCPYCGSDSISGHEFESESGSVWQEVDCYTCSRTWQDVYSLTDVDDEFTFEESVDNEDSNPA